MASLRSQLADATDQYNDDKHNHYVDLMNQGYDKLVEDANEALENIEDAVKRSTEKQSQIIGEMLKTAGESYKTVYANIKEVIETNGIVLSDNTQKHIDKLGTDKTSISNIGTTYSQITTKMVKDSESITGASGILTTAINKLGTTNGKLDQIVKKTASVKSGFTNINTEIDKVTKSFNNASKSILKLASDSLAQIKKLTNEVDNSVKKATESGKKKATTDAKKDSGNSLKGNNTSNKNVKNAKTVTVNAAAEAAAKKQKAYDYAISYIAKNARQYTAKQVKKSKSALTKNIASINGNKTITDTQSQALTNKINSYLGSAFSQETIYSAIAKKLKEYFKTGKVTVSTGITKLASGSKKINKDQLAITNEEGWEAIYRKSDGAILTPLNVGDKVFTNEMSENLWKLAQGNTLGTEMMSKTASPVINNVETYKPNITVSFENFMTVQGNVDKDVLGDLKDLKNEWMTDFSKHLTKEFGMLGNKRRFS